jgi:histidinol dehydrogenase
VRDHGWCFVAHDLDEAARVATALARRAPRAAGARPRRAARARRRGGRGLLGDHTPEAAGDYLAGPSHVLPTGGAVRFSSPLGVYDFTVRTSVVQYSREALARQGGAITALARLEGLEAHARAVETRLRDPG